MAKPIEVSDSLSNAEEQIERAAKIIGTGKVRPKVFEAIYYHKTKVKTVSYVMQRHHLTRMQVLQNGRALVQNGIATAAKRDGETAYEQIEFFHANKPKILHLAANPKKLAKLPTKRKPTMSVIVKGQQAGVPRPSAVALTIDDLDSFAAVRDLKDEGNIPRTVSEVQFKHGVQAVIGEFSVWKDWGGELADLVTTRVRFKGRRMGSVFAFKGPGTKGKLVMAKMGKNGDQIWRMFSQDGSLYVVQYVGDVDPNISSILQMLATAKSLAMGKTIYYLVIDGADSDRLYRAYPEQFGNSSAKPDDQPKAGASLEGG